VSYVVNEGRLPGKLWMPYHCIYVFNWM